MLPCQLRQPFAGFAQGVVVFAEGEARLGAGQVRVLWRVEESGRNAGDANLGGEEARELNTVAVENVAEVGQDEVGAFWNARLQAADVERLHHEVALGGVHGLEFFVIGAGQAERGDGRLLRRVVGGEGDELVRATDAGDEIRRAGDPADLPAGDAKGFAEAGDGDGAVEHAGHGRHWDVARAVEGQVLVDFVGDAGHVELVTQVGDQLLLFEGEDAAGGVLRRVDDYGAGFAGEGGAQLVGVEGPVGRVQRHEDRRRPGHRDVGHVAVEIRLDDDDLVAGIDQPKHAGKDGLGRAGGDEHVLDRVELEVVEAVGVGGDGLPHAERPRAGGVLVDALAGLGSLDERLGDFGRAVEVGAALAEVDGVVARSQLVDFGEDGRAKAGDAVRKGRHTNSTGCNADGSER